MAKSKEKISEALGITLPTEISTEPPVSVTTSEGIEVIEKQEIVAEPTNPKKDLSVIQHEQLEKDAYNDYKSVRKNLSELIEQGKNAIDGVLLLAEQGESARTYEVVADLIRTVSGVNKDLMDIHQKIKTLKQEEINISQTNNNSIYVGSTKELQELINTSRSVAKQKRDDE